jgi:sigma-B regulation protein RsbQ
LIARTIERFLFCIFPPSKDLRLIAKFSRISCGYYAYLPFFVFFYSALPMNKAVLTRNNVVVKGDGDRVMLFAHGYGCDQAMWRFVAPAFEDTHKIILFDHVGAGKSDLAAYDKKKYSTLEGYADDILEICAHTEARNVVVVGHSVSAMIAALATIKEPSFFSALVMVCPSPRYINDGDYVGGFSASDIEDLLGALESNYLGWAGQMAPAIMGNPDRPELGAELANSFCQTDPDIARHFARVTFTSDNRADLPRISVPSLILQCSSDIIAPLSVGEYVRRNTPNSALVVMNATGHCPHLSAPEETVAAIRQFLNGAIDSP